MKAFLPAVLPTRQRCRYLGAWRRLIAVVSVTVIGAALAEVPAGPAVPIPPSLAPGGGSALPTPREGPGAPGPLAQETPGVHPAAGIQSAPPSRPETAIGPVPVIPTGTATAGSGGRRTDPDAPQPRDSLDSDLVYAVMVAEVAARRGDQAMAFTHYLHAAQLARDPKMAELAVRAAVSGGDDAGAGRAVAYWLEIAPEAPGAHQVAALLRIKAGDREGALTHLSRLIKLAAPDAESGYLQAAGIIGRATPPADRLGLMRDLVELDGENPEAQFALAMVAASIEQNAVATAAARRALELRPDWEKPRLFLVRLLLTEGKRDAARTLLEEFVTADPDDQGLGMFYGQFLVEEKEFAKARDVFANLLSSRPQDPELLFAAGVLSLELDDLDGARIYFTRLYQTGERRDEASFYLGQVEERAEHPAAALAWYAKTQGANRMDAQVRMAVLQAKAGEVERAREIVQQLRDQFPDEARNLFLAEAEILDQVGLQDAAMQVYGTALAALPNDSEVLYGRAMYAVKLGRIPAAEQDLRRIIERNPDHADALNALGYTLADRTDRHQEALGFIQRAYRLKPTEPAILDSVGWVNYKLGRYEIALEYLQKANEALKDGEIAAHLGEVLWALGRQDEARAVWDAALQEHPDHAYLQEVVGRHRITQQSGTTP